VIASVLPWLALVFIAYRTETAAAAAESRLRTLVIRGGTVLALLLLLTTLALAWACR
jgi:hypothetical protein